MAEPKLPPTQPDARAEQLIKDTKLLPPVPTVAVKILQMAIDEFVDMDRLANVIGQDPSVTARVLGLANSAYYAQPNPIHTITDAIIKVLGLDLTRGVAVGVACSSAFDTAACPSFSFDRFWGDALSRAALAKQLAELSPQPHNIALCQLGALLQDIGLLAAATIDPGAVDQILTDHETDLPRGFEQHFGCHYRHLGAALARKWELPADVVDLLSPRAMGDNEADAPERYLLRAASTLISADLADDHHQQRAQAQVQMLGISWEADAREPPVKAPNVDAIVAQMR